METEGSLPLPSLQDAGEASDTPCHGAAASSTPMQHSYQEYSYPSCTLIKACGLITPVILNYIPAGSQFSYFYLFEVVRQAAIDVSMNSVKAPIVLRTYCSLHYFRLYSNIQLFRSNYRIGLQHVKFWFLKPTRSFKMFCLNTY